MGSESSTMNDERYREFADRIDTLDFKKDKGEARKLLIEIAGDLVEQMRECLAEMRRVGEPTDDSPLVIRAGIGAIRQRFATLMEQGGKIHDMLGAFGGCDAYHEIEDPMLASFGIDSPGASSFYFGGKVHDPAMTH